jgi:Flp pilus assembly protein TadG
MLNGKVGNAEKGSPLGRRFLKRFIKDERGSAAIEFAMLALPFFALMFAILESGLSFTAHQVMANSVEDLARDLRTGVLKKADASPAVVRARICNDMKVLVTAGCPGLYIDLKSYATYGAVPTTVPYAAGDLNISGFAITPGDPDTINQLRVFYKWPIYTNYIAKKLADLPNGKTLLFSTLTWRNEYFPT